jgi:NADPH-dependent 2,4-dienoyl-CoA reductase/sulfur reductase-like enzyme/rhodanese-related sulfurtransferase
LIKNLNVGLIMDKKRLVIVGGVAGGASAAARARRLSENPDIIIFERGPHVSFANCGLPYYIGGEIAAKGDLLLQTPQSLKARFNLDVRVNAEVVSIDRTRKCVTARELNSGQEYEQGYDDLILSTGAAPLKPPIPGIERPGHFTVRNIPDVEQIMAWLKDAAGQRAVIVGGGYIGLEMAEQLQRKGLSVALVEALPQVMAPLDPEMAAWLHAELRANGIDVHLNSPVTAFEQPVAGETARASMVILKDAKRLPADVVVLGLGVRPETGLAKASGLEIGSLGGIRVNDHMQTSDPCIWAVGDAIEVRDPITGTWSLIPLAGPANRQGRIAADNIFEKRTRYKGTWGTSILRLFNVTAGCTGANEKSLQRVGMQYQVLHLHPLSHALYYPGATNIAMKIIFDPQTGKLLGAQAVGQEGVDKRIDVLATALQAGLTVNDIAELELSYSPPYGSAKDPVNMAGMAAENVLNGYVQIAQWFEVEQMNPDTQFLLDVRNPEEYRAGSIPGALNIPLGQLRKRLGELPKDREIIVHCQSGQRSYFAARLLMQEGFIVRNLTGSYRTWKNARDRV